MNGISLVMATLHRVQEVKRCLDALLQQDYAAFELIVVDQNRDDRLCPLIDEYAASGRSVTHLRQEEANQCLARNTGLAAARFDIVAFPDDDCWYEPDTLSKVAQRVIQNDEPAAIVIRWVEQDPTGQTTCHLDVNRWRKFREVPASMITQFYCRKILENLGGFDPRLGLHSWFGGGEETDLMFRTLGSAAKVVYLPDALVHHHFATGPHGENLVAVFKRARSRARGTGALYAKHSLDRSIVTRGFAAPLLRALSLSSGLRGAAHNMALTIGRIEGYSAWRHKFSHQEK